MVINDHRISARFQIAAVWLKIAFISNSGVVSNRVVTIAAI
jgi:hypothetical protein